jgi:hypothetical protein
VRRSARVGWMVVPMGLAGLAVVLLLGLWGYDYWANDVPPYRPPLPVMPSPNGYDRAAALTARLPSEPTGMLPRWPDGTPQQLRLVVQPVLPTLDAIHATFQLQWQAPPALGLTAPHQKVVRFRGADFFLMAASRLAEQEGHGSMALQRGLDAMELAVRSVRGRTLLSGLEAVATVEVAFEGTGRIVPRLPAAAIPPALARVRRVRRLWPSIPEFLEADRVYTLADLSWTFRHSQDRTPLQTLHRIGTLIDDSRRSTFSQDEEYLLVCLAPKRQTLRSLDRYFRQSIAETRKPPRQWRPVPLPGDRLARTLVPLPPATMARVLWLAPMDLALLEVALAVQGYRGEVGHYPAGLAEIPPRWLPAVPMLPWGQRVGYELRSGQPEFFIVRPDNKRAWLRLGG